MPALQRWLLPGCERLHRLQGLHGGLLLPDRLLSTAAVPCWKLLERLVCHGFHRLLALSCRFGLRRWFCGANTMCSGHIYFCHRSITVHLVCRRLVSESRWAVKLLELSRRIVLHHWCQRGAPM